MWQWAVRLTLGAAARFRILEVAPRLMRQYCKMAARGLPAAPIAPGSCHVRE